MSPLISVIYVNYNTSDLLIASIRSLILHSDGIRYEIIIVDNNSNEEEKETLKKIAPLSDNISVQLLPVNRGFGAANNAGACDAKGTYLLFLNPDTIIKSNVLTIFFDFLSTAPSTIAACGASLFDEKGNKNHSYGNFPGLLQEVCMIGFGLSLLFPRYYERKVAIGSALYSDESVAVDYIVGADIFIKADLFKSVGGFDEGYFMYYEDADLCKRLFERGYQSIVLPQAEIVHLEGGAVKQQESKVFNLRKFEMLLNSKLRYYKKWKADKLWIIKPVLFLQATAQFIKGKHGNNFALLLSTYLNAIRNS